MPRRPARGTVGARAKAKRARPTILFIDDEANELARSIKQGFNREFEVQVLDPEDLERTAILQADLILVDFDLAHWHSAVEEKENKEPIARRAPQDGLALIGQLRSIGETAAKPRPTAYAIHTGQKSKLPGGLSWEGPDHLLARALSVEWVFEKSAVDSTDKIVALARAARLLPRSWPHSGTAASDRLVQRLLRVDTKKEWASRAVEHLSGCEPPRNDTVVATRGLAILRWMLHGVLPYPTFLIDDRAVALRIGVTPSSFRKTLEEETGFRRLFAAAVYNGILAEFVGPRWWRAGLDSVLWAITKGAADPRVLTNTLVSRFPSLQLVSEVHPVPLLDTTLRPTDEVADITEAVEIRPDGWPVYAERAWIALEDVIEDERLRSLVVEADAHRVAEAQRVSTR